MDVSKMLVDLRNLRTWSGPYHSAKAEGGGLDMAARRACHAASQDCPAAISLNASRRIEPWWPPTERRVD